MTTAEMIRDVFENAGEPSDLEIDGTPGDHTTFSIALEGSQKILSIEPDASPSSP